MQNDPDLQDILGGKPSRPEEIYNAYSATFSAEELNANNPTELPGIRYWREKLVDLVEKRYGFPAVYALFYNDGYTELTATLFEEDRDVIRTKINDGSECQAKYS